MRPKVLASTYSGATSEGCYLARLPTVFLDACLVSRLYLCPRFSRYLKRKESHKITKGNRLVKLNEKKLSRETAKLLAEGYRENAEGDLAIAKILKLLKMNSTKAVTSRIDIVRAESEFT